METINNTLTTAKKAIWGEQEGVQGNETAGREPISGVEGKGTLNEPYDQGNAVNPTATDPTERNTSSGSYIPSSTYQNEPSTTTTGTSDYTSTSANTFDNTVGGPHSSNTANKLDPRVDSDLDGSRTVGDSTGLGNDNTSNFGSTSNTNMSDMNPTSTERSTGGNDMAGNTGSLPPNTDNAAAGGPVNPDVNTDKTGVTSGRTGDIGAGPGSDINPSNRSDNPGAAPSSGGPAEYKQQGADKPRDAPDGRESEAIKDQKDDGEAAMAKRDPNDKSGEPMHMHGGGEDTKTFEGRRQSKAGNPGGQEHKGESEGTGEQWVKTSGMAADGGDFDATKPGAGREADRLMEQKGIQKSAPGQPPAQDPTADSSKGSKPSLGEKIKDKLHIGGKDK